MEDHSTHVKGLLEIESAVVESQEQLVGCLIQAFTYKGVDSPELYFGQIRFCYTEPPEPVNYDYGFCQAKEKFVTVEEGLSAVHDVLRRKKLLFDGTTIPIIGTPNTEITVGDPIMPGYWSSASGVLGHQWPTRVIAIPEAQRDQSLRPSQLLIHPSLPLFPDFNTLVSSRVGLNVRDHLFRRNMVITVPNLCARICEARVSGGKLRVSVETRGIQPSELLVKAYALTPNYFQADRPVPIDGTQIQFDVDGPNDGWGVVLCHRSDARIIDSRRSHGFEEPSVADLESLGPDNLQSVLSLGENQNREFKPWPSDDKVREQVARSAIAFANSDGGVIFVGVADDGSIEGAPPNGNDALLSMIRDRCDPSVSVTSRTVTIEETTVYALLISRSDSKPHLSRQSGAAYIRVASTDRHATRQEIGEMFEARQMYRSLALDYNIPWATSS